MPKFDIDEAIALTLSQMWLHVADRRRVVFDALPRLAADLMPPPELGELHAARLKRWSQAMLMHRDDVLGFDGTVEPTGEARKARIEVINRCVDALSATGTSLMVQAASRWLPWAAKEFAEIPRAAQIRTVRTLLGEESGPSEPHNESHRAYLLALADLLECIPHVRVLVPAYLRHVFRSRLADILRQRNKEKRWRPPSIGAANDAESPSESMDAEAPAGIESNTPDVSASGSQRDDHLEPPERPCDDLLVDTDVDELAADPETSDPIEVLQAAERAREQRARRRQYQRWRDQAFGQAAAEARVKLSNATDARTRSRAASALKKALDDGQLDEAVFAACFTDRAAEAATRAEIGARLGLNENQVRYRRDRACWRLAAVLEAEGVRVPPEVALYAAAHEKKAGKQSPEAAE